MSVIIFIIILGLLIFVHELGHFLVAKKSGIRVDEFAVGFPPRIISWTKNGTRYALNLIPFGGYVKIFGENPDEESLDKDAKDSFVNKSKLTQAAVLVAGVVFNVLFAWVLFASAFAIGFDVSKDTFSFVDNSGSSVQIISVQEETPAQRVGLSGGEKVFGLTKGDTEIAFETSEVALNTIRETQAPFTLKTSEGDFQFDSKLKTEEGEIVGFYLDDTINTQTNIFDSVWKGFLMTGFSVKEISIAMKDLIFDAFKGEAELENVAGPVGIVGLVGDAAESGIVSLILFTAFISINLAVLNLLPFPALDGGRLLFILIEVVTRKNINPKVANVLNLAGFLILIGLMIVITVSDIGKLF
jgi:regulator of sigma E protease